MKSALYFMILSMLLSACNDGCNKPAQENLPGEKHNKDHGLIAALQINDSIVSTEEELSLYLCLTNNSLEEIELMEDHILRNAVLSLLFFNEMGDTLATIPPVTPYPEGHETYKKILKPNEKYTIEYNHLSLFNPSLPKGKYRVCVKLIASNDVWFEIR